MNFKKMILVLTITFSAIFTLMLGSSYAYYVSTGGTTLNATTGNFDSAIAVVFNQSQYINVKTGIPLHNRTDAISESLASSFTLVPDSTILDGYEGAITISLTDLSIDDELRVDDLNYEFSCQGHKDLNISIPLSVVGTGEDFTDAVLDSDNLVLGTISTGNGFDASNTYECSLYIYLLDNDSDQNHLMNKNFSARIKVNTAFRK